MHIGALIYLLYKSILLYNLLLDKRFLLYLFCRLRSSRVLLTMLSTSTGSPWRSPIQRRSPLSRGLPSMWSIVTSASLLLRNTRGSLHPSLYSQVPDRGQAGCVRDRAAPSPRAAVPGDGHPAQERLRAAAHAGPGQAQGAHGAHV